MEEKDTAEEAKEKKEYIEHTEQLISFWQGKLNHDDSGLISPTSKLLIQDTIQRLKKMNDIFSLGYVQKDPDQSLPDIRYYEDEKLDPKWIQNATQQDMLNAGWVKVKKE